MTGRSDNFEPDLRRPRDTGRSDAGDAGDAGGLRGDTRERPDRPERRETSVQEEIALRIAETFLEAQSQAQEAFTVQGLQERLMPPEFDNEAQDVETVPETQRVGSAEEIDTIPSDYGFGMFEPGDSVLEPLQLSVSGMETGEELLDKAVDLATTIIEHHPKTRGLKNVQRALPVAEPVVKEIFKPAARNAGGILGNAGENADILERNAAKIIERIPYSFGVRPGSYY